MTHRKALCFFALLGTAVCVPLAASCLPRAQATPAAKAQTTSGGAQPHEDEGQRIFDRNCARCHAAPEGFSLRISGTVIRHMRVRASLSKHDEEELMRFMNP